MIEHRTAWRFRIIPALVIAALGLGIGLLPKRNVQAQADRSVVVDGTLVNVTPGGRVPTGTQVELRVLDDTGITSIYTRNVATDTTGLYIEQAHLFLVPDGQRLYIAEIYSVSNSGDRTYVGGQTATNDHLPLSFTVPAEAENLRAISSGLEEYTGSEGTTLVHTQPIVPGTATVEISFSYERPYREGMRLTRDLDIPIQSVLLLLQGGGLVAEGTALSFNGTIETQMGNSASYLAGPLAAGEILDFSITAQQGRTIREGGRNSGTSGIDKIHAWEILLGIGALAATGFATFAIWKPAPMSEIPESARPLLTGIAQLDYAYANGEIDEAAYRAKRAALKQALKAHLDHDQVSH
jgi:hypothetical protein